MSESILHGIGVGGAAVSGPVARMGARLPEPPADAVPAGPAEQEDSRARAALAEVAAELNRRAALAGGEAQGVLEAQAMMAEDPTLAEAIAARTAAGHTAERAVHGNDKKSQRKPHRREKHGKGPKLTVA